ncbi:hypothetical protein SAMN04489735_10456 [Aneurinibacillus thermoaerophilus]|uniref:Uncharacterized protein n=1 Tax=Aneurinibacillus thermoaerophilus TaxID=143495 RepID=A0A1G8EJU3_ANETH|nr:hypothetical protein [Aneurinibacillus thermoaerophilus]SDH70215.1 hypothetical protein SAMN04489735_10456 [Aneurinibacillus thermoaerophilus]
MIVRNEIEISYATLRDIIHSFPRLSAPPRTVFEYDVEAVRAGPFPCVGIRKVTTPIKKMIDKHEEYTRTEHEGKHYAWYETGRYTLTCTVALFMDDGDNGEGMAINPIPFLREWELYVMKKISRHVRFLTVDDPVPGEAVHIKTMSERFEQHGKRLYSVKNTVQIRGKLLEAEELLPPLSESNGNGSWVIHQDPSIFK